MAEVFPAVVLLGEEVAADATTDVDMLDTREGGDLLVEVDKRTVVGQEVFTYCGLDAAVAGAFLTECLILACHAVHVGGGTAEVGDDTIEVVAQCESLYFFDNRLLGTRGYLLALMGRNGAERAPAETAAMDVDGVLYHLVGGDGAALLVLGMWQAGVREVERGINLLGGHGRLGWVDNDETVAVTLDEGGADYLVALLLDNVVVLGLGALAFQAGLKRVELYYRSGRSILNGRSRLAVGYLGEGVAGFDAFALVEDVGYLEGGALAHAVVEQVGGGVGEDAGEELIIPIVIMCQTAHGGLDACNDNGDVGVKLLENARIDVGGAVGAETSLATRGIGIVVTQTTGGSVVVYHAVHDTAVDPKEETWLPKLAKVAQVVAPVRLRDDGDTIACGFERAPDDGRAERGMVDIGIARDKHDVNRVPPETLDLL